MEAGRWVESLPRWTPPWLALLPGVLCPHTTLIAVDYAERERVLAEHGADVAHAVAGQLADVLRAVLPARRPPVATADGRVLAPVGALRRARVEAALRRLVDTIRST